MKKTAPKSIPLFALAICLTGFSYTANCQQIFSDTFETNTSDSFNLNGQLMSDGVTTYSVTTNSAIFQARTPASDSGIGLGSYDGQIFANPGNRYAYIEASSEFDNIENYTFNIGYLNYSGIGEFGINARSNSNSANGGYLISWSSSTATFSYVDSVGTKMTLGSVTATTSEKASAFYLNNISVTVTGDTQQLYVDGVAIGGSVATQGTYNDSTTDQVRFYGLTTTNSVDLRIDNISATAIPEPKTTALIMGLGFFLVTGFCRQRKQQ